MTALGAPMAPRSGGNKISAWIKRNKLLAGAAVAGGGVLLLSSKGGSGGGNVSGVDGTVSDGPIQLVPVSAPASEGSTDYTDFPNVDPPPVEDQPVTDTPDTADPGDTIVGNVPTPTTNVPTPTTPTPTPAAQGVNIHGKVFAGATSYRITGSGNNVGGASAGRYTIYSISFPGKTEHWWYYTTGNRAGTWTGPHSGGSSSSGGSTAAVVPNSGHVANPPQSPAPTHQQTWGGHNLAWWQNPANAKRNGKWKWPDGKGFVHTRHFEGR
jgi:hypothetical protein